MFMLMFLMFPLKLSCSKCIPFFNVFDFHYLMLSHDFTIFIVFMYLILRNVLSKCVFDVANIFNALMLIIYTT